jgi:hypothetical protein
MNRWLIGGAAALLLAGSLGSGTALAEHDYYDDDPYGYYDDGGSDYEDADVYYENHYGADNAYDLYFYRSLGPHGEWIYLRGVGYVWRPFVVAGWLPYSLGYWGWQRDCWTWISYEPFGHVAYHYGNWAYLDSYGWCWFPGYRWLPHTVTWSSWNGHVGWCPTPPRIYSGYRYTHRERHFVWVPQRQFLTRDVSRHILRSTQLWRGSREPRSIPILSSPSRSVAERWTGRAVEQIRLQTVNRSTRRGVVQVFLPDQQNRDRIRREGREVVRPWLDTKKLPEGRPVRPWQRRGESGESGRVRPWQRQAPESQGRVESRERSVPRERPQARDSSDSSREERQRGTPWRRYRPEKDQDDQRSDQRRGRTETRRRSEAGSDSGREQGSRDANRSSRSWRGRRERDSERSESRQRDSQDDAKNSGDESRSDKSEVKSGKGESKSSKGGKVESRPKSRGRGRNG